MTAVSIALTAMTETEIGSSSSLLAGEATKKKRRTPEAAAAAVRRRATRASGEKAKRSRTELAALVAARSSGEDLVAAEAAEALHGEDKSTRTDAKVCSFSQLCSRMISEGNIFRGARSQRLSE